MWIEVKTMWDSQAGYLTGKYLAPPEGVTVMTTDGTSYFPLWYLMSGSYRWVNYSDELDKELPLPFEPTHWMTMENFKIWERDKKIDQLL
jgi:hypothetical protein